jgi:hypothetical protein
MLQRLLHLFAPQWLGPVSGPSGRQPVAVHCPHCGMRLAGGG